MRYFKILDEKNYITAVGCGEGGIEIDTFEYNRIKSVLSSSPSKLGYAYHLTNDLIWEAEKINPDALPDDIVREMFKEEILASVTINKAKPGPEKEGFILKQEFDPEAHAIVWVYIEDPNYVKEEAGTYTDPITYSIGMEVLAGLWYTDGDNIWEAIQSGVPESFEDVTFFDIITV